MLAGLRGWHGPMVVGGRAEFSWSPDAPHFTHVPQTPEVLVPQVGPSQAQGCQELIQRVESVGDNTCDEGKGAVWRFFGGRGHVAAVPDASHPGRITSGSTGRSTW